MKRTICLAVVITMLLVLGAAQVLAGEPENKVIRCSTTTSVNDTGLLPFLQPDFEALTGYELIVVSNGSGAAIKLGESGDADVLLVHSKAAEEEFVLNGYGLSRISFMYNYFVIIGPASDPAGIAACEDAAEAFTAIADSKSLFVSRGDESGTHTAEKRVWTAAGLEPGRQDDWYISAGAGMGASLNQANEREAYILSDKATFLSMQDNLDLVILLERGEDMKNVYSLIACNPEKTPGLNAIGAQAFIDYMTGEATLEKIADFGKDTYGQVLFYVGP
ncbi:MAG: substrate-binding domain-containing protein [Clostridia bacterium]|nr:substrate-binding domain-containing protein [Clostridia bacterium]